MNDGLTTLWASYAISVAFSQVGGVDLALSWSRFLLLDDAPRSKARKSVIYLCTESQILDYHRVLDECLSGLNAPLDAICCDRPGDCDRNSCLEVYCESIVGALRKAANRTIPKKRCKAAQKPCWDREVQQRQKEASKFYWKWKQEGKPRSGILFEEMKQSRQAFRRELKRIKKAGERQECETLLKKLDSANSNAFWRSLKKQ